MIRNLRTFLFVVTLCIAADSKLSAQDTVTVAVKHKWQFLLQPYGMFPVMDGTIGLGNLPDADIHANTSDIFSNLKFGAMLYFEANNDHWAITSDIIYMNLKQDIQSKTGILSGEAGAKQFVWELAGLKRLSSWLDAGIGFRLVNISSDLTMSVDATVPGGPASRNRSISNTWFDPLIIARAKFDAGNRWFFQLRGDLGGFGVGSEFTWQAHGTVDYRFSKLFRLGLGYRIIGIDYKTGSDNDRFLYDVDTYGPEIRFGFHF